MHYTLEQTENINILSIRFVFVCFLDKALNLRERVTARKDHEKLKTRGDMRERGGQREERDMER